MRITVLCLLTSIALVCAAAPLGGRESDAALAAPASGGNGEIEVLVLLCAPYGATYNLVRDVMEGPLRP
jgi:hypothetical protein